MDTLVAYKNDLIKEKDMVIIRKGTYLKSCRVIKDRPQKLGRPGKEQLTINLGGAIGHIFGSSFRMVKSGNRKFFNLEFCCEQQTDSFDLDQDSGFDNRDINDDGNNQSLSKEDIQQLVDSGTSGDVVIQTLVQNNKTFPSKTKYSQEKYVSKKQRKYVEIVTLHRPSIRLLLHMHYMYDPLKISNLRIDTLSQMMSYGNIQSGGAYAVYEAGIQGLVTAAMMKRIGRIGSLVHVYSGSYPHKESVEMMEFTLEELQIMSLISAENLPKVTPEENEDAQTVTDGIKESVRILSPPIVESGGCRQLQKGRKFIRTKAEDVYRSIEVLTGGLNGIIVASRQHPQSITLVLLSYLKPGHSFVVYSPYKEPLMELFVTVRNENCVNVRLTESWLRNFQILPQRTHPEISMSGGGGYLLTGWKVAN